MRNKDRKIMEETYKKLIAAIKAHEGTVMERDRHVVYRCPAGKLTIGYGRNVEDLGLSDDEAKFLLENDILRCVQELAREYPWFKELEGARRDAIINIFYNLGATTFRTFKNAIAAMERGEYKKAGAEFLDSKWATQVRGRAIKLSDMITTNTYPE